MAPGDGLRERKVALDRGVHQALEECLPAEGRIVRRIIIPHVNAFRRAPRGNPPVKVKPMTSKLNPGAQSIEARPRRDDTTKNMWLAWCIAALTALGLVVMNLQSVRASPAVCVPNRDFHCLVRDYQAVNA